VSRLAAWCLRTVTSRERAQAILGDIAESAATARDGRSRRHSRRSQEIDAWRHIAAEIAARSPSTLRAGGLVFRDAVRSLRATPALTAFVLLILTLGISAATITFSVVDAVILRPLPFHEPSRLVAVEVRSTVRAFGFLSSAPVLFYDQLRDRARAFSGLAAATRGNVQIAGEPERILSARVTAGIFELLGVRPVVGQTFTAAHEIEGQDRVAVIGYDLWRSRFGGDPAVVGRSLTLSDKTVTVIGVMPAGFAYPLSEGMEPLIWTPYVAPPEERSGAELSRYLHVVGRLAPGAAIPVAQAEAEAVFHLISTSITGPYRLDDLAVHVRPIDEAIFGGVEGWMLLVLAAVGLVMLVACANVANLMLARATKRARELSVRASIGASRRRLIATMLVESLCLSLAAAALGLVVAIWGVDAARAALPAGIARASHVALDLRVLASAIAAAVLTGLTFGAVPAWQASRQDLVTLLKDNSSSVTAGRPRWRSALLVAEVAFVGLLLVATTLFVSSFVRVTIADLGFERRNLLVASGAGLTGSVIDVLQTLEQVPGVTAAGAFANGSAPLAMAGGFGRAASATVIARAGTPRGTPRPQPLFLRVSPGYLDAAGIKLLRGRDIAESDFDRTDVVVIDARTARALFEDADPVGESVEYGNRQQATVIGVAATVLDRGPEETGNPCIYLPTRRDARGHGFLVRTTGRAADAIPAVRATLDRLRPGRPSASVRPLEEAFRQITADRRFAAGLMSLFGLIALLIGAAGIYAVTASVVAQQRREIGIRMALGATVRRIFSDIVGHTARHLGAGLAIGLGLGLLVTRGFSSVFFGVTPTDPWVHLVVTGLTLAAGFVAAVLPARRATRVDPLLALRSD
jgi:predicted permease